MRILLRIGVLLLATLLAPFQAGISRAQTPAVQSIFLGDRTCGDTIFDCSFDGVVASHRYLHVVLYDSPGDGNWQVQIASSCSESMPGLASMASVPLNGYGEATFDLQAAASQFYMQPACYVFRGLNGRQAVFYAAYFDDNPKPDADQVYPGYQQMTGRPDLPDLDVGYISRSPRYAYDGNPNAPAPGQQVTFAAHLLNAGGQPVPVFSYVWLLDGKMAARGSTPAPLPPNQEEDISFPWRWDPTPHTLAFQASVDTPQISTANDRLQIRTNALLLGFWVERSAYQYFRDYQWEYCRPLFCAGSDSFEDWLQRQVSDWNIILGRAVYPGLAPAGIADRVRVDEIVVVPDGSLPLSGSRATNTPDERDHTVDLEWGLPAKDVNKLYTNQIDVAFDRDWSTIHELNHARSLADLYRFDIPDTPNDSIAVTDAAGRPVFDPADPFSPSSKIRAFVSDQNALFIYRNREQDLMSCPCTPYYSAYSALTLNRIRARRARCANTNPPCTLGDWFADIPPVNRLRLLDRSGRPLPDGTPVRQFYDTGTSYNGHAFDNAHSAALTVHNGEIEMGADPFRAHGSTWVGGHNLLLLEVQAPHEDEFCFEEPTDFNMAYWLGYRDGRHPATYTFRLGGEVDNGCYLTLPRALINEPFATSPYRSQVRLSRPRHAGKRLVRDLTIQLLDDARPVHPMTQRLIDVRSAVGRLLAHGTTGQGGQVRLTLSASARTISVGDVTDNNLVIPVGYRP